MFSISKNKRNAVDHFVHIGFDSWEHNDFTNSLKKRVLSIVHNENHFLNFVDQYHVWKNQYEEVEMIELGNCLSRFTYTLQNIYTYSPSFDRVFSAKYLNIPQEVRNCCEDLVTNNPILSPLKERKEYADILQKHYAIEQTIWLFLENEFDNVLNKISQEIQWKNVFNLSTAEEPILIQPKNEERRNTIVELAISELWEDRIIFSWMNDWDLNSLIDVTIDRNRTIPYFMKEFWNAQYKIDNAYARNVEKRIELFKKQLFSSLEKSFENVNSIQHIVGWEYYNRCVASYACLLSTWWVENKLLQHNEKISLNHENDSKKSKFLIAKNKIKNIL